MNRPRVLLADDHAAILEACRRILLPDCEVVGQASDGESLLEAAERWKPDVIVTDISMPVLSGLEACRQLRKTLSGARVILMSAHADSAYIAGGFQAGASGYVLKREAASELAGAVRSVFAGRLHLTASLRKHLWDDNVVAPGKLATLTERQQQLVMMTAECLTTKEIASAMGISFKTVVRRRAAAMRRLQISERRDLVRFAVRCRLEDS